MIAYVFPGQGAQYPGMGKKLFDTSERAKRMFGKANEILGFDLMKIMFDGDAADLKQTRVTQPAVFMHSVITAKCLGVTWKPGMVAGHSLGEFSALVAANALTFEDGLQLVSQRAQAMQKACELEPSTMAAIVGLDDNIVEEVCAKVDGVVVAANYNCPGQLVISGGKDVVDLACENLKEAGARMAKVLAVGGAFHSPLMEPAKLELEVAIKSTEFKTPMCPVYQNVDGKPQTNPDIIKENLIKQLTAPVRWTTTMQNIITDGAEEFIEVGPGKVLQGLVRRIDREIEVSSADVL